MKVIIPAKASSSRVPNKNFRPFWQNQSLLDLTIAKVQRYIPASDIYVSCEDKKRAKDVEKWGANFLLRDEYLCDNFTPISEVVVGISNAIPSDDDILWCQVIDPLFDSYGECLQIWSTLNNDYDSLVVVYPQRHYLLDAHHRPEGFGFGPWHVPSQMLPVRYQLTFTTMFLRRETIERVKYYVGAKPYWFHAENPRVDIDTEEDYCLAQAIYGYFHAKEVEK